MSPFNFSVFRVLQLTSIIFYLQIPILLAVQLKNLYCLYTLIIQFTNFTMFFSIHDFFLKDKRIYHLNLD